MTRREFFLLPFALASQGVKVKQTVIEQPARAGQLLVRHNGNLAPFIGLHPFAGMVIEDTDGGLIYYFETTTVRV